MPKLQRLVMSPAHEGPRFGPRPSGSHQIWDFRGPRDITKRWSFGISLIWGVVTSILKPNPSEPAISILFCPAYNSICPTFQRFPFRARQRSKVKTFWDGRKNQNNPSQHFLTLPICLATYHWSKI